jgi:hypothetical protein
MESYYVSPLPDAEYLCAFDARWEAIADEARAWRGSCRRAGDRWHVRAPATIFCDGVTTRTTTLDLSSSGCAVESGAGREGDPAIVILHLPRLHGVAPLTLPARCARVSKDRVAFGFHGIADSDRLTLAEALDQLQRCSSFPGVT